MKKMVKFSHAQQGSTLFIAVTFLVVITLMGLSGMQTATLQERMVSGDRDYSIALQAAEMALRDAERDLMSVDANNNGNAGLYDGGASCPSGSILGIGRLCYEKGRGEVIFSRPLKKFQQQLWRIGCPWGQCYVSTSAGADRIDPETGTTIKLPIWSNQSLWDTSVANNTLANVKSSVTYGTFTKAPALDSVSSQPKYIIETLYASGSTGQAESVTGSIRSFRITARATGVSDKTVVMLQEVFQCSDC